MSKIFFSPFFLDDPVQILQLSAVSPGANEFSVFVQPERLISGAASEATDNNRGGAAVSRQNVCPNFCCCCPLFVFAVTEILCETWLCCPLCT